MGTLTARQQEAKTALLDRFPPKSTLYVQIVRTMNQNQSCTMKLYGWDADENVFVDVTRLYCDLVEERPTRSGCYVFGGVGLDRYQAVSMDLSYWLYGSNYKLGRAERHYLDRSR